MPPKPRIDAVPEAVDDDADGKIVRLGIQRDENLMYYLKQGDVWATPRKTPGKPIAKAFLVSKAGVVMDFENFLYYVDADGDIARKRRSRG